MLKRYEITVWFTCGLMPLKYTYTFFEGGIFQVRDRRHKGLHDDQYNNSHRMSKK